MRAWRSICCNNLVTERVISSGGRIQPTDLCQRPESLHRQGSPLKGLVYRLRVLAKTTFLMLHDCSGEAQCVTASEELKVLQLKLEDTVEIYGRSEPRRDRSGVMR